MSHQSDIIRELSYHRLDFDKAVIHIRPHEQVPAPGYSRLEKCPTQSLGVLDQLPLEILHETYRYLDIQTLINLRSANSLAKETVDSMPEYRHTMTNAASTLQAVLKVGVASHFTMTELFSILCTQTCIICKSFGAFLFIPSFSRCCFDCIKESSELCPIKLSVAKACFGLNDSTLKRVVPIVRTLPGVYSLQKNSRSIRYSLVAKSRAKAAGIALHNGEQPMRDYVEAKRLGPYRQRRRPPFARLEDRVHRSMVVTPIPFFDRSTSKVQTGISCKGCHVGIKRGSQMFMWYEAAFKRRDKVYSEEGFLKHFTECKESQDLWKSIKEGTSKIEDTDFTRRNRWIEQSRGEVL